MQPQFFTTPDDFRRWLEVHHESATELLVGYYKKGSGTASITWPESVEQALCFGWIDGVRRSIDEHRYSIRFTPRRPGSIWSKINIAMAERLKEEGKMYPMGLAAYARRQEHKSKVYSFEQETAAEFPAAYTRRLKGSKAAWDFWKSMPSYYRKTAIYWVMSAKQESTRQRRLDTLIADSEAGRKIKPLSYGKK